MGGERSRLPPLPREIAIDEVRPVAGASPDPRFQFFKERELAGSFECKKRSSWECEDVKKLRDGVAAGGH